MTKKERIEQLKVIIFDEDGYYRPKYVDQAIVISAENIHKVRDPTFEQYLEAVRRHVNGIQHVPQTETLCLCAIETHGAALGHIKWDVWTERICAAYLKAGLPYKKSLTFQTECALLHRLQRLPNRRMDEVLHYPSHLQTENIYALAAYKKPSLMKRSEFSTDAIKWKILKSSVDKITEIPSPSQQMWDYAIKEDPKLICSLPNPTEEQKWAVVKGSSYGIALIKHPTNEMLWWSIEQNGHFVNSVTRHVLTHEMWATLILRDITLLERYQKCRKFQDA